MLMTVLIQKRVFQKRRYHLNIDLVLLFESELVLAGQLDYTEMRELKWDRKQPKDVVNQIRSRGLTLPKSLR